MNKMNKVRRIFRTFCALLVCVTALGLWAAFGNRTARPYRSGNAAFNLGVDHGIIDTRMDVYDAENFQNDRPTASGMLGLAMAYSPGNPLVNWFCATFHVPRKANSWGLKPEYREDVRCSKFVKTLMTLPEPEQVALWGQFAQGYKAGHSWAKDKSMEPAP